MSSATTRVKRLITRYFNQLLRGCQNSRCQNPNCASSTQFQHSRLTPNQAAILAIQLTTNQAELCYPDEATTDTCSENMPLNTEDHDVTEQHIDATESRQVTAPDHATSSTSNLSSSGALTAAVDASSLSNVIEDEESSRTSFMTPGEVTRLLMFLFDAADNEDVAQPRSSDNQTALTDAEENQSSHYSSLFSPNYGCGAFLDAAASGANTTARPSSSSLTPFLSSANPSSDALKSFLNNTNPNSNLASLVSSLNTIQERESRTRGLTLGELKETLDIGKEQGDWSHLISLLSAVFSSYEALSSSFLAESQRVADDSDLLVHRTNAKKPREDTRTQDVIPMDVSVSIGEIISEMDQHAVGKPTADNRCEGSVDRQDTKTSLVEDLPVSGDADTESTAPLPPVSIPDVRLAWSLISSIPEQQNVVDVLLRAVRRLVVGSLYQLLVSQAPDGLGDIDPPPVVRNTQQRLLNLFCILYECPFATDPLHFDRTVFGLFSHNCPSFYRRLFRQHLLLNINRAVTWLPISLQARLCHIWADTVRLPLANCTTPPAPEHTNLWSLQSILQQNITLRCLTTSHGVPNEDKQLCEAALVLRIVYYASLLAGQMDKKELLEREAVENRDFELLMRAHRSHEPRVGRSRNGTVEDPLAKALSLSPNDCRHPFIPAKDFINETLNEHLKVGVFTENNRDNKDDALGPPVGTDDSVCLLSVLAETDARQQTLTSSGSLKSIFKSLPEVKPLAAKRDYVNYRSKDTFGELSFMRLPFLLQTGSKSVLLYYDNRMRMLDEQRGAFLQSLFVDNPELPYLKIHVSREQIVEGALLALEITCSENPGDLKKQLRVEFEGEQGVDEGGLSREFFQLIIEKVFDPVYGMFVANDELGTYWFNPVPLDDLDREYFLIGTLLGLAIYNDIILNVCFPSVLYRKLCGKLGTFEDLEDANPDLYSGLRALLDYTGDDVEEAFGCNFVVAYQDPFGNTLYHELKPDGTNIHVTKENRQEFVDLYANFLLNESVKKSFNAFRRGFQLVVDESPLSFLFRPDEIELLVCGSRFYDFKELERVTTYEDYTVDSPVIKNFWDVVHNMTTDQQRQLLQFCTGSDRIPVGGMAKMKFTIARQGADTDRLPTAHTCFNILLLPDYPSREELERMLLLAITHCKGFGVS
ncbi:hypothetical protein T265_05172 [Opisthorchis viverrini]|uniref:HECT-type E3 ubiquitin transferase n=1 Tax=Opisthorchis viverrini TaxID=6198 RepID=A0A074ZKN5_OPIVI|nr:hypothetical protein T265_05172 [Opisthorchis viverrini]KER27893.1 hypothetical protein T265_05172 [Opisthorchis viverrini]